LFSKKTFGHPKIEKRKKKQPQSIEDAIGELYKQLYCLEGDLVFSESIWKELPKRKFYKNVN